MLTQLLISVLVNAIRVVLIGLFAAAIVSGSWSFIILYGVLAVIALVA